MTTKLSTKLADIRAKRVNGEGFTLVELLIVVVILVVLAAIAVPIFLNQSAKAKDAAAQSSVSAVASAISVAKGTEGTMGTNGAGTSLIATDSAGGTITVPIAGMVVKHGAAANGTLVTTTQTAIGNYWCVSAPITGGTAAFAVQTNSSGRANTAATGCP